LAAGRNVFGPDVAIFILHLPHAIKEFGAVAGEISVWTARFTYFFLVQCHFLSLTVRIPKAFCLAEKPAG
jgi:hypothetical protein